MSQEQDRIFANEASFDDNIIDDEVFVGPVTARELEITWRKRIAIGKPPKGLQHNTESAESPVKEKTNLIIEDLPSADTVIEYGEKSTAPTSIIKPATLVAQSAPGDYKWAKKINMKKINQPKRPVYVLSPSKFNN